jgi:hypothetical protein
MQALGRYLPALMSLGSALGIALHSLIYNWDTHIKVIFFLLKKNYVSLLWVANNASCTPWFSSKIPERHNYTVES